MVHSRPHGAIVIALALAGLLALWFPLVDRDGQSLPDQVRPATPVLVIADGRMYAFASQAQTVAGALAEVGISIHPQDTVLRQGMPVHPTAALRAPPRAVIDPRSPFRDTAAAPSEPVVLRLQRGLPFTVHEGGLALSLHSSLDTVGQALTAAGLQVGPADVVRPSLDTPLSGGLHVYVRHANAVQLTLGDQIRQVYTFVTTVSELLREQGITWDEDDRIDPPLDTRISDGLTVTVTFVRRETEVTEEILPYSTVYRDDPDLEAGQTEIQTYGSDGYIRRQYRVTYENDREVSRELIAQDEVLPVDRVITRGTKIVPGQLVLADGSVITYVRALEVYVTWYNAASSGGDGITATGLPLDVGIVAVDPNVIPLGTRLYIPGYGFAVAADTGGAVKGNIIDLGYPGNTIGWCCTGYLTVYILE